MSISTQFPGPRSPSSYPEGVVGRLQRALAVDVAKRQGGRAQAESMSHKSASHKSTPHDCAPRATGTVAGSEPKLTGFLTQLLGGLERWAKRQDQRELDAYLSKATDGADLEARLRRAIQRPHRDSRLS